MSKKITDALITLDSAIQTLCGERKEITLLLPYIVRHEIFQENLNINTRLDSFRGMDSFTLYRNITIEPTKNETEQKLRGNIERAKKALEDAQNEYNTIIGEKNG